VSASSFLICKGKQGRPQQERMWHTIMKEIPLAPQGVLWSNGLNANTTLRSGALLRSTRVDDVYARCHYAP